MLVYKFGGASIERPERMEALLPILSKASAPLVVVVSAMGKTTNALEAIVFAALNGQKADAHEKALALEASHRAYAETVLSPAAFQKAWQQMAETFTELQWAIDGCGERNPDYHYDQIVCTGELLSTRIFAAFLSDRGLAAQWADARDLIRTDDQFREAKVDLDYSFVQIRKTAEPLLQAGTILLTQGFIGATPDNASTTLGREGSDYSAALLAAALDAQSLTIWKDVDGLQNADPRLFDHTVKIEAITYAEVIEMAYYGAQVIHPKTIQPLQNKGIPLHVRCFLKPEASGTVIDQEASSLFYPPLIILKRNQVLLQVTTLDFSFITEENLSKLYRIFSELRLKINLLQNAAISFVACIDNDPEKLQHLIEVLRPHYRLLRNEEVTLLTVRHYTPEVVSTLTHNRHILLEQKTRHTLQCVYK
ncbi:MAG: aspartate kinase [Sphingobacteriales bacterium]|nr:MAG: aspartate kinase [Sphingobacteriales bacterium]